MRIVVAGLLLLAACSQDNSDRQQTVEAEPAALTFEGGDYKDQAAKIAHGERVGWVVGCQGCHGANLQGQNVTADDPKFGDMNAPNVTLLLAEYSDRDLGRLIRHGVPKDGRELWFMPPENFQYLSEPDFDALVAYLRTFKPAGTQLPPIRKGPEFNRLVATGELEPAARLVARFRKETPVDLGEGHRFGRYIAMTTCTECHNSKLQGYKDFSPDLDIAGAYSPQELEVLLTTGKGKTKPDLGLMSAVARGRFAKMTPSERSAVIAYALARAQRPQ